MNKTFVVLGSKGMLGQMAVSYFSKEYKVIEYNERFQPENKEDFISGLLEYPDVVIINAIGRIKQKTNEISDLLWSNTILPLELKNGLHKSQIIVHPSTDCVYDGNTNKPYAILDTPNAKDSYGWSKRLGEVALEGRPNTLIPRVSIIGPDNSNHPKGLLGWFLYQEKGSKLNGYSNHLWNGITTLEWCKRIENLLLSNHEFLKNGKIFQMGTAEHYNKFEMLEMFNEYFNKSIEIRPIETDVSVDRRLVADVISKSLLIQLEELLVPK